MNDEQVVRDGNISFIEIWASQSGFVSFLLFGWNIGLIKAWLATKKWKLKITNQRIDFVSGVLSTTQESFELYRAQDSEYSQTPIQMIFGVGHVKVLGNDVTTSGVTFPTRKPAEMREQIRVFIREQRKEMGTVMRD